MAPPRIVVTMGDPSGIGPEVVAKALSKPEVRSLADLSVVGSAQVLFDAWRRLSLPGAPPPVTEIQGVPEGPFPIGQLSLDSARAAHAWIEFAAKLCLAGEAAAMVTAPVNKDAFQRAGIADTGHQEVLSRLSGATNVKTMLISGRLRCMHLSTHKSLAEACRYVTRDNVLAAIQLTHAHFARWGVPSPRIAVAALNPHASDNGLIGREELDEIAPAVTEACALGIDASGPHPADSVFNAAIAGRFDVVVVMYHDQGHIPIKVYGFEQSISVNLGLPFIRTSVDHGTAFDIAGQGVADETSMVEAVRLAANLATGNGLG
ncbi:MAG: 4-hydroxythreonine-4-phosphate dehydrogenase PdxA [Dehalococcoidia bacterium]|nr:4-hydroxythreonine-4-phosphate dehydrogenase PdxA [Dehalococcoidia bacterium]